MNVVILGCSYRTAPVGVRERLAFTDEQVGRALDRLSACPGREAVLLSTCNRVELYLGYPGEGKEAGQELLALRCVKSRNVYQVANPQLTEEQMSAVQDEVFKVLGWL